MNLAAKILSVLTYPFLMPFYAFTVFYGTERQAYYYSIWSSLYFYFFVFLLVVLIPFYVMYMAKIKDVFSELKKVTWPSFGTVLKNLGSVLAFVVIMLALVLVIDFGLQQGLKLIRSDSTAAAIEFIGEILPKTQGGTLSILIRVTNRL